MSVNEVTGLISGTPTSSGVYFTTFSTENQSGYSSSVAVTFNITAVPPAVPVLTSAAGAAGIVGNSFSYSVAAGNFATMLAAASLPPGLSFNATSGLISGTPTAAGTFSVPLTATNSLGQGAGVLTIAIAAVAPAPPLLGGDNPLVAAYTLGSYVNTYIDASGNPLSYACSGLPPGLSVGPSTGLISGTFSAAGVYPVTITATNGAGSASAVVDFVVTTSAPEFLYLQAEATGYTGVTFSSVNLSYDVSSSATAYAASGLPPGLSINTATGLVTGTPTAAGAYPVTVSATNAGGTGSAVWNVIIINSSAARPFFDSNVAEVAGVVGQSFFTYSEAIPEINSATVAVSLTYSCTGLPPGVAASFYAYTNYAEVSLSGTPTVAGVYPVTITFTTAAGLSASEVVTISIATALPSITSAAEVTGNMGSALYYTLSSGSVIASYGASGLPPGLTLNASTGVIAGTPTATGTYAASVSAAGVAGTGTAVVTFVIGAPAFGGLPLITSAATTSCQDIVNSGYYFYYPYYSEYQTSAISYTITAINLPTSFGATNLPAGLSINPYTGVISGNPLAGGVFEVPITATNAAGTSGATLTIIATATFPTIVARLTDVGYVGSAFAAGIETTGYYGPQSEAGAEFDPVTFAAAGLPPGLSLDTVTGYITGTPTEAGTYPVVCSATNRAGTGSAVVTIAIGSTAPPVIYSIPSFSGAVMAWGFVGLPLNYSLGAGATSYIADDLPAGLSLNVNTGAITGVPTVPGTFTVPVGATNPAGSTQAVLTIVVDPSPPVPVLSSEAAAVASVGTPFLYVIETLSAVGEPTVVTAYGAGKLPAGLSLDTQNGFITGTPTDLPVTYVIPISASIGSVAGTGTLTLTLQPAAVSTGPPVLGTTAGALGFLANPFSYSLTGTGFAPTSTLPAGLSFNSATGAITGYPASAGVYQISLAAPGAGTGTNSAIVSKAVVRKNGSHAQAVKQSAVTRASMTATTSSGSTAVVTLNVINPALSLPRITSEPSAVTALQNGSTGFLASAVGIPALVYQWSHNGVPVPGGTSSRLGLNHVQPSDSGVYTLTASNITGQAVSIPAELTVQQTYATWQAAHFTPSEIAAGQAADNYDLEGDGVINLLKYALGIDPISGTGGGLPLGNYSTADRALQLAFTRDLGRTDIDYVVEASPDLSHWMQIASSTAGSPTVNLGGALSVVESAVPGTTQVSVVVEDSGSAGTSGPQFLRLRVVRP